MKLLSTCLLGLVLVVSGCGNLVTTELVGATAVTVDAEGSPVALIKLCKSAVDQVTLSGTREGLADNAPNPTIGQWDAAAPQQGTVTVNLRGPSAEWDGPEVALEPSRTYVLEAGSSTADEGTSAVTFASAQLASLGPQQVITGDTLVMPRKTFEANAC